MMKTFLKFIGIVAALGMMAGIVIAVLLPRMDRWGATEVEVSASFPGDELVPAPVAGYTRAVTVNANPADIYPWLVQMGAEKGGMYSYEWLETNILQCELINADQIHPEWQNLRVGDKVKMCPGESGPRRRSKWHSWSPTMPLFWVIRKMIAGTRPGNSFSCHRPMARPV
jgi:hypothetical protein